eukprot:GHVS01083413.1.p1 GENE.GHVS01083413.1~~GHVS01083413.1.p1  ORF type:complete len:419 (+),score=51.07 GHVS01083413.1:828-2084(+)
MLFYANSVQLLFSILFLLLTASVKGIGLPRLSHIVPSAIHVFTSIFNYRSSGIPSASVSLLALAAATVVSQITMLALVRRVSYRYTSSLVLCIPATLLVLLSVYSYLPSSSRLTHVLSQTDADNPTPFYIDMSLALIVLIGASLYRLDPQNALALEYIFPPDPYIREHWKDFRFLAPLMNLQQSHPHHHQPTTTSPGGTTTSHPHQPTITSPGGTTTSPHHPCLPPQQQLVPPHSSSSPVLTNHHHRQQQSDSNSQPSASSWPAFYLPSPLPGFGHSLSPLLAVVRPVLMNVWSGNLLCEYTDYKCNFDHPVNSQALQTSSTPLLLPRDYPHDYVSSRIGVAAAGTLSWGRLHAADMVNLTMQYTAAHMTLLGDKEDCLRTLYRCHRMGTLAASMAFHSLSSDDGSVVSSETSDEHNG